MKVEQCSTFEGKIKIKIEFGVVEKSYAVPMVFLNSGQGGL
jgi:hypothetical protein